MYIKKIFSSSSVRRPSTPTNLTASFQENSIIVGRPFIPSNLTATSQATSISLSWSQPAGRLVESYTLAYSFEIRGCFRRGGRTITDIDGTARSYTITRLRENSDFVVNITAMNRVGNSPMPARIRASTLVAGEMCKTVR